MMKKSVFLCLFLAFLCTTVGFFSQVAEAAPTQPTTRWTALVLDNSGSMNGAPIAELKKASKNFCGQILSAEGYNYIAVLNLDGQTLSDFTDDLATLEKTIDNLSGGSSDPEMGLKNAAKLFDSHKPANDVIKNIVVMSDGCPGYTDPSTKAAEALWPDYNVYSLGFFHSLSGTEKERAEIFMAGLQNAGYYEVTNGEELDFEFGNIAGDILGGNNTPIIFVPGIMGSELVDENKKLVWPPISLSSLLVDKDMSLNNKLVAEDHGDQQSVKKWEPEKIHGGTARTAYDIIYHLCRAFPERPVYFFAYDWRQPNDQSARELKSFIDKHVSADKTKVDIVAHSMGGLVASRYYKLYGSKINRIITIATPYEGAPDALKRATDPQEITGEWYDQYFTNWCKLSPETKRSYCSLAEISPTKSYIDKQPLSKLPSPNSDIVDSLSTNDYFGRYFPGIFGLNAGSAVIFQDSLKINGKEGYYNVLRDYPKAYFFIAGGRHTINNVVFGNHSYGGVMNGEYDSKGDGTVPYQSATMMGNIETLPRSRWAALSGDHTGILKDATLINEVINVLKTGRISSSTSPWVPNGRASTQVRIACPVDATITNGGEVLNSQLSSHQDVASFGRVDIFREKIDIFGSDDEIKLFRVDDGAFPVRMQGTGAGKMDYSISFYDEDNNLIEERAFTNVKITSKTILTSNTRRDAPTTLVVDENGDGIPDYTLYPVYESPGSNPDPNPDPDTTGAGGNTTGSTGSGGSGGSGGCNAGTLGLLAGAAALCLLKGVSRKR